MQDESIDQEYESQVLKLPSGKLGMKYKLPSSFQGHTFCMHMDKKEEPEGELLGPYRIEFVLANEFLLHLAEHELSSIEIEEGYSNLFTRKLAKLKSLVLHYQLPDSTERREAEATFKTTKEGRVQRFVITIPEEDVDVALRLASQFAAALLDSICFRRQVPLQVRHIELFTAKSNRLRRRYMTMPFVSEVDLEEPDLTLAPSIPKGLVPPLRLFREAISSSKPHYRLLCFYRAWEGALQRLQAKNNEALKSRGIVPERPKRRIPDIELTREYFPDLIGEKFAVFLDHVRKHYRIPVAHLNFDEFDRMVLDPAYTKSDHRIDFTNAALQDIIRQMIQDEWDLMKKHGL